MAAQPILLFGAKPDEMPDEYRSDIEKIAKGFRVIVTEDRTEIESLIGEVEIAARHVPAELFGQAGNLKWMQWWYAGVDFLRRYPELREKDFILTNGSGVHAESIGEQILGYMIMFARQIHTAVRDQASRTWRRFPMTDFFEIEGKTALVLGAGAIGRRFAKIAGVFRMNVIGVRRSGGAHPPGFSEMHGLDKLPVLLPRADFVVISLPDTDETRGLIGRDELIAMKSSAFLINIGRGSIVDERALNAALETGEIAGAALDVFETEPLPSSSPLWDRKNAIITPHTAGFTPIYWKRVWPIFRTNLVNYLSGKPLMNVVDKKLGY